MSHRRLKNMLWQMRERECHYCGVKMPFRKATVDHLLPISLGGSNRYENIVLACLRCNNAKGNWTPEQFQPTADAFREQARKKA